jgi:hypothetical protein
MGDDARAYRMLRAMKISAIVLLATCLSANAAAAAPCPLVRDLVCTVTADGTRVHRANACVAQKRGERILHKGDCVAPGREPAMCNMLYQPVCATDPGTKAEKTYPNLCHAEVANASVLHDGQCAAPSTGNPPAH